MIGRNANISYDHFRVDPKLVKGACAIHSIPRLYLVCVDQLDKYWLKFFDSSNKPMYVFVKNVTIKKQLVIKKIVSSWNY